MAGEDHVIDIVIQTSDKTSGGLKSAQSNLLRFDAAVERTMGRLNALTERGHKITLSLIDRVTPQGSRINGMLQRITGRAYKATLGLENKAEAGIRRTTAKLFGLTSRAYLVTIRAKDEVSAKMQGLKQKVMGSTLGVASDMLLGAGVSYGIYGTIKKYKDFEAQMSAVAAISGATGSDFDALTAKAKEMGAQTVFSATDAGKAFEYMAMAGWKTDQMVSGIEGIMNLAAASGEDLGRVSDIVTDALTAFGLKASDSAHFADVLAQAATNSNTNVSMMGETFKYVAPLAGSLKYSIEDVALAIGLMANSGIKASEAGTALRSIFTRLVNPPKTAGTAMDQLGISVTNADGSMKPLRQTMRELRTAFSGLTDSQKTSYASMIAGQEAMSGFLAIINASDADFDKLANSVDHANGAAKRMADIRMDNLSGDIEQLGGAWETFQLQLMSGKASGFLREFVQGVTKDIENLNKYMKDGLDISDFGKLAMDIITQLKNKFLELDGVGSILAGGVLVGALAKITSMGLKAVDKLRDLSRFDIPGGKKSGSGIGAGPGNIGSMVVNAQSVVVNSKGMAGSGMDIPIPGENGGNTPGKKGGAGRFLRSAAGIATAVNLGLAAYDLYSTKQNTDNDRLYADNNLKEKAKAFQRTLDNPAATPEERQKAEAEYNQAASYRADVNETSRKSMNASIGHTAGTAIGAIAGGFIGGPMGAFIGSSLGGMAGSLIGEHWDGIAEAAGGAFDAVSRGASEAAGKISETFSGIGESISGCLSGIGEWINTNLWTPISDGAINTINFLVGLGALFWESLSESFGSAADWFTENVWTPIAETAEDAWTSIGEAVQPAVDFITGIWSGVTDFFSSVWQSISDAASSVWEYITSIISSAWDSVTGIWSMASEWFQSTVWSPISSAVDSVESAISGAFQAAYNSITGIFSGLAGWFESNVIGPVKAKFDAIRNLGASITGLQPKESPKANGGFISSPTHILAGENGPEVIIPLNPTRRNRAADLLQKSWSMVNGDSPISSFSSTEAFSNNLPDSGDESQGAAVYTPTAVGMDDGDASSPAPIMPTAKTGSESQSVSVNLGGFSPTITIQAGNGADAEAILQVIRQNIGDLADEFAGRIAEVTSRIHANQPVEMG